MVPGHATCFEFQCPIHRLTSPTSTHTNRLAVRGCKHSWKDRRCAVLNCKRFDYGERKSGIGPLSPSLDTCWALARRRTAPHRYVTILHFCFEAVTHCTSVSVVDLKALPAGDQPQFCRYAGAGLYDSVQLYEPEFRMARLADCRLVYDTSFRQQIMWNIASISRDIEAHMGCAQDIEGVIDYTDRIHIVQSRPQV